MSAQRELGRSGRSRPRIVIHGGAGNITRSNLPPSSRNEYLNSLASILASLYPLLVSGKLNAVQTAVAAVQRMEDDPLFNAGKGAVFTLDGHNELEASLMVSRGYSKRCASVFLLKHVKNPILLAKQLLEHDDKDAERGTQHNCLSGPYAEKLAAKWGLDIVDQEYFFTEKRWRQHLNDLKKHGPGDIADEDSNTESEMEIPPPRYELKQTDDSEVLAEVEEEYLPKGTVGCVVLDSDGVIAVATSTGGLTNKVPGRIGDTPTPGAGYWAEEWQTHDTQSSGFWSLKDSLASCLPVLESAPHLASESYRALGLSGTGNGDYFLRLSACHNITSRCRFGGLSLKQAARAVCGPGGEMELAGDGRNDPDGAVIGLDEKGSVIMEMNCGGCFRGTVDDNGRILVAAYSDEALEEWRPKDIEIALN